MENKNRRALTLTLIIGFLVLLTLGLIYAWSIFKKPISDLIPQITNSQLTNTFTISMIFFCIGGFFSGLMSKRINSTYRLLLSGLLIAGGMILMSTVDQSTVTPAFNIYFYYGVMCGFGVGVAYNTILSHVLQFFPGKSGIVSGVLLMGFGFGGMILGSLAQFIIKGMGISITFFVLGLLIGIIVLVSAVLLRFIQPLKDLQSDNNSTAKDRVRNYRPSEMVTTTYFAALVLWTILISASGLMVVNNASQIAVAFGVASTIGLFVSIANGLGRVVFGHIYDKVGGTFSVLLAGFTLLLSGLAMYLSATSNLGAVGIVGIILAGMAYGSAPSLASALVLEGYGKENYSMNFSIINLQLILSSIIGPLLSTYLFDNFGQNYNLTFLTIVIFAVIAVVIGSMMNKFKNALRHYIFESQDT